MTLPEPNAASVALLREGRVLLIRRARSPFLGDWTLPGGRREPDETIETCAIREVAEEIGVEIRDIVPVMRMPVGEGGRYSLQVFATTCFSGDVALSDEVSDFAWLTRQDIAPRPITPRLMEVLDLAFSAIEPAQLAG
ncbi:MAG: NUDIX hydrolase [Devosia sp.]